MLKTKLESYKKAVLIYGSLFFLIQFVLAVIFYKERLYADSSFFIFQTINKGWFHIEHHRFLLAACEVLPLIGYYLGLSMKALLILYSLNHVLFFFLLFLLLVIGLNDIYGGLAIMAVMVFNVLYLYVMPYLESWYAAGLVVLLYSILTRNKETFSSILVIVVLEVTILFSHPSYFILLSMIICLNIPFKQGFQLSTSGINAILQNKLFIMLLALIVAALYKALTLDKYEGGQIDWVLNSSSSFSQMLHETKAIIINLWESLYLNLKISVAILGLMVIYFIRSHQPRKAIIVLSTFVIYVIVVGFLFGESIITMYSAIHYIPITTALLVPFFYYVLPAYNGRVEQVAFFLLFVLIGIRSIEQINSVKPYSSAVEQTEKLINASDKVGGNKFFIKAPDFISPFIDWTYPIQTLLLSAERGKSECRSFATDEDTTVIPETKRIFSDSNLFLITRFDLETNSNLNHKYFNCEKGIYKTIDYTTGLYKVFSSELKWNAIAGQWKIKQPELLNSKPAVHFTGEEFGFAITIPADILTGQCVEYLAKLTMTHVDLKANCSANALVVCDVSKDQANKFYAKTKLNNKAESDSSAITSTYVFEIPADAIKGAQLSFYIWNLKKEDFYITNAAVQLFQVPN